MDWNFTLDRPVYTQIMEQIRWEVLKGVYPPGGRVPSVRTLAAQAQVNPNTVQHALHGLEKEGLLETQGTGGRYVTRDASVVERLRQKQLEELVRECNAKFAALGLSPAQGAQALLGLERKGNNG